jgi:hypothetical protein
MGVGVDRYKRRPKTRFWRRGSSEFTDQNIIPDLAFVPQRGSKLIYIKPDS